MIRVQNYINGAFVDAEAGDTFESLNPATGEVIAILPRSGAADADAAAHAAHTQHHASLWLSRGPEPRAAALNAIADAIEADLEAFAQLESLDTGKPILFARTVDIPRAIANLRFFAGALLHDHTDCFGSGGTFNYVQRRPVGPVALITPWNLPLYLLTWKLAPALAMGNPVVCKPSELSPLTADRLAHVIHKLGLPAGLVNMVHGYGAECAEPLVASPLIKAVSFTGGTATGKRVSTVAAPHFKKVSLELGGKNSAIVYDDADVDTTVNALLRGAFSNNGQICLCNSRIFLQDTVYERYADHIVSLARELRMGPPQSSSSKITSLISRNHRSKVQSYIDLAEQDGARIHRGCTEDPFTPPEAGAFLQPAVIEGLPSDSRVATEEIFGPVVTLHPFSAELGKNSVISQANNVPYGLSASVFTSDLSRAHRTAELLDTGIVWINDWLKRDLRTPFGGLNASGLGREGGRWSLDFYSEPRNIYVRPVSRDVGPPKTRRIPRE